MSLRVWLPLNGSLENKGISNITVTNNGATVNSSGKIGSCYSFSNNSIYGDYTEINNLTQVSGCCWVYLTNLNSAQYFMHLGGQASWPCKFSIDYEGSIRFQINGTEYVSGITLTINTWYHITVTWDGSTAKLYVNGVEKSTKTAAGSFSASNHFAIGARTNGTAGNTFAYGISSIGKLNDVRIYDHCLSAAEVHEISQGLVLHYKLDSAYSESSQNLCTAVRPGTGVNITWGGHVTQWTNYDATNDPVPFNEGTKGEIVYGSNGSTGGGASRSICRIAASPSTAYTYSCYIKASDNLAYTHANFLYKYEYTAASGGTTITEAGYFNNARKELLNNGWYRIWGTFTTRDTTNGINISFYTYPGKNVTYWLGGWQIEQKDHVTPFISPGTSRNDTIIQDSSGYGYNGTINSMPTISSEVARYSASTSFDGVDDCITVPYNTICPENIFTINLWFKKDTLGSKNYETLFGGPSGFEMDTRAGSATSLSLYMASTRSGNRNTITSILLGNWYMVTMTRDGVKEKYYVNGIYQSEIDAKAMPTGVYRIGAWASNTGQNYYGLISDFRIYCTALSAEDILSLYHTNAKADNLGNFHTFEFIEKQSNILFKAECARAMLTFSDGLSRYQQSNCQVTLTDNGYRIYRPPNLTTANDGNTMWGGLKIVNQSVDGIHTYDSRDNIWNLQHGHTYIWGFHAKGQSSNSVNPTVQHNMGWNGIAGMNVAPTVISVSGIPANFQGEKDCFQIFTIGDSIIKTATETKGGYQEGSTYLSYRHLCLNYGYTSTGALGTDLYLTNFYLYDITSELAKLTKQGQAKFYGFIERNGIAQIRKGAELLANNFIER